MAISIKLKRRWDIYPTLQEVLAATQNLSISPFGLTEEGLQDFRGIKLIGERAQVPLRSSDSPLKEELIKEAKSDFAPHTTTPYRVAHPKDFLYPEEAELTQALYDFVCKAAEATGCRVK